MGKEIYKKTSDGLVKLGTIIDDPATKSNSVQKTGDTMAGGLVINKSGTTGLVVGGTATNISTSVANETTVLQIDAGTGGATNSSAIGFHNPNISSAVLEYRNTDANTGYFNFKSDDTTWSVKVNGNTVIDAGNIGSQSVASATKATQDGSGNTISSTYLPLAGGTMKNGATIAFANSGHWSTESTSNSGVTFPYSCGGLSWSDQSDGVSFYAEATGNDNLDLVIKFTDDNSNKLSIRNASGTQTAYITSSGTGYFTGGVNAATKATQDGSGNVITSTYVNLSGTQTISGIKTFSKSSGFNYSGIETATSDSFRNVWFSHSTNAGTPVKHDNFKYNPSTNTLQVGKFYGKEAMLKEADSSYTATVGGYDMYTWDDDFCVSLRNTDETHDFYILQYDYSASKLITSNNLTAKTLTTSQNSNYIDFVTYGGTNFGLQGNSGTVYNLASFAKSADLKKVATSGSYSDLSDKPTIGNGTLTLQRNFTELGQFSANQTGSKTINISVPTKLSELTNDLVNNGTLTIQAEGTTKGTFTANQSGASTINLKASDFGLSSALKFLGTSSTEITEGSTTSKITLTDGTTVTATTGNVVLYGHKEFIWNAAWEELGDESSHALKSVTVTGTGALSGGGSLEANRTITHNTTARTNNTSSASPAVGGTFTAIDSVTSDSYGHITAVNTKTVTMPYDTSKLPLTGGTIKTNNITTSGGLATVNGLSRVANTMQLGANGIVIVSPTTANDCAWIRLTSSANESEELEIATGDDGTTDFNVHFRGYNTSNQAAVDIALPKASGTVALTSDVPSSLKNPNAISFKNTSGSTVSYDGSSAVDLTGGVYQSKYSSYWGTGSSAYSNSLSEENTSDTWVPVMVSGTMKHRVIPTEYNTAPGTYTFATTRGASRSTSGTGYWAAMVNSAENGSPTLPSSNAWWHVISMDWTGSDINNWFSQLALPTQDGGVPYYRRNNASGISIESSTWHAFITDENIGSQSVNYATSADKLDGYHADTSATAGTVVARDSNGFIYGKYFNSAIGNEDTMSLASVYCSNDNWIRKMSPASFRNTNAVRKWCMVGSDTASTSGYYKVASQTLSGYGDSNVTFMVTSTYGNYMSGILQLQIRSDNTSISCKRLGWLARNGFSDTGAVICVISGMTYTIYAKQSMTQYGRIMFEVISESSISANSSGITLYNSNTPESTAPTATVNDSDIGYVSEASRATNVNLSVSGSGTKSITIKAGSGTAAAFTVDNVANATYATSSGKATQDGSGNTITSTYVKKISADDTKVYANSGGTDTSYTVTSVNTTPNTIVFRNGSTGYSVINTPADTSTTSTYIANTGWVNTKLNTKADKATTLAGYGITDAKISNGTITLGSNSITPLTSHLTVDSALSSTSTNPVQNKVINSALSGKASSSHTHTTSLASSTGTSSITLAHGGKYQLTTGGTSVIFTMPSDSDSHYTNSFAIQGNGTTATTFSQNANKTLNIVGSGATTVSATTDKITITSTDTNTWRGIQNNLTSTSTTDSLSAAQGKALNEAKVSKSGDTMTGTLTVPAVSVSGGRVSGAGDDEGIVINYASNNYAGVCLGTVNGERSVFYKAKGTAPFWRYNNGTSSYDLTHPGKAGTIATTADIPTVNNSLVVLNNQDGDKIGSFYLNSPNQQTIDLGDVSAKSLRFDSSVDSIDYIGSTDRLKAFRYSETMGTDSNFSHGSSDEWAILHTTPGSGVSFAEIAIGKGFQLRFRPYIEGNSTYGTESAWGDWKDIAFTDDITSYCQSYVKNYVDGLDFLSGNWDDLKNSQTLNSVSYLRPGHVNIESGSDSTSTCYLYLGKLASATNYYPKTAMACIRIHGWWGGNSNSSSSAYYKNVVDATISVYKSSATSASANTITGTCYRYNANLNDIIMTSDGSFYLKSYTASSGHACHIEIDYSLNLFVQPSSTPEWTTTSYSGTSICSSLADPVSASKSAGSTNSTSKLYLIGATSQGASTQTYSNSSVYASSGTLYATNIHPTSGLWFYSSSYKITNMYALTVSYTGVCSTGDEVYTDVSIPGYSTGQGTWYAVSSPLGINNSASYSTFYMTTCTILSNGNIRVYFTFRRTASSSSLTYYANVIAIKRY